MKDIYSYIKKYAAMLASQGYPIGTKAQLFVENDDGVFATKKGVDFAALTENDIEKQSFNVLPKANQDIHAVLVSQTPSCSEWLKRGKALIPSLDDMAQIIGTKAAVIDARGSLQAATPKIARIMKSNAGCFVADSQNADGSLSGFTLTVGRTPYEAIVAMGVLEKSAEVTLLAEKIGTPQHINAFERRLMRTIYLKKYSKSEAHVKAEEAAAKIENPTPAAPSATPAQSASAACEPHDKQSLETLLRAQLVEHGKRLVSCGLVQGTWGNLSARLDETHMLVTPSGLDYMRLTPADMVKVNIETLEYEGSLKPTSEKGLHAAIYRSRAEIGGIIHTHSKYCSVYAAARCDLHISADAAASTAFTDPVHLTAYALPGTKALMNNTAAAVGNNSGAIMAGHGMIVCGTDLAAAFDNAQTLEAIAEATLHL